jgi:hypothetical protein
MCSGEITSDCNCTFNPISAQRAGPDDLEAHLDPERKAQVWASLQKLSDAMVVAGSG